MPDGGENTSAAIVARALERLSLPGIAFLSWTGLFAILLWKGDRALLDEYFATFGVVWVLLLSIWVLAARALAQYAAQAAAPQVTPTGREPLPESIATQEIREAAERAATIEREAMQRRGVAPE